MRWNLILLAAGYSRRFGDRKLLAEINGTPLYRFSLDKIRKLSEKLGDTTILVVTSYPEIEAYCRKQSVIVIKNDGTDNTGIASSIQKAVKYLETQECALEGSRKADVFFTADQPGLDENEVWMFLNQYASQNKKSVRWNVKISGAVQTYLMHAIVQNYYSFRRTKAEKL
ncbi:MAG: NTP transferase domain-containing protein [Roseburia inulinivorans]